MTLQHGQLFHHHHQHHHHHHHVAIKELGHLLARSGLFNGLPWFL
jgi:hypothetical protein